MVSRHKTGGPRRCNALLTLAALAAVAAVMLCPAFPAPTPAVPRPAAGPAEAHGMGWVPTPPGDYPCYEIDTANRQFKVAVDLSSQMPPVGDQLSQNCCVAWATGYYYKTWQEGREHGWPLTGANYQYSPAFIFNQLTSGGEGIAYGGAGGAFQLLQDEGCTDLGEMAFNEYDHVTQPTAAQLQAALPYRIPGGWSYFFHRDEPPLTGFATPNNIAPLKAHLDAGEPFVIGTNLYDDFPGAGGSDTAYYDKSGTSAYYGGHGMCVVGYDDNANPGGADADHKGGFKIVNSWGSTWNGTSAGFIYLSYDFMKRYVSEAWQMDDNAPDTPHVDSVTPNHGGTGDTVTIDGYNFGTNRRSSNVVISGYGGAVQSWTDSRIVAKTTADVTGDLVVLDWTSTPSNLTLFYGTPALTGIAPPAGPVGTAVILTGSNFGPSRQAGCYVSFGGAQAVTYGDWNDTNILCDVPAEAAGQLQATVTTPGGTTLGQNFTVIPLLDSMGPAEGSPGTEVTLTGSGFGTSRGSSYVEVGAVQATQYNLWSEDEIKFLVPQDTPGLKPVRVHTSGGDTVPFDFALAPPSASWYLAEGCTGGDFETWVLVQNPNGAEVTVDLTLMASSGELKPPALQGVVIPGDTRRTFNLNSFVTDYNVSTRVASSGDVVCERAMYGNGRQWAHESVGTTATSSTWYLAEGCTEGGMETWVLVQNPNDSAVTVDLELQSPTGGGADIGGVSIPAKSRQSFNLGESLVSWDVSTLVTSEGGNVVCERAMYGNGRAWAHDSVGARSAATQWYLAEGCTAGGFETWVLVQNPGDGNASVDLELQTDQGKVTPPELQDVIIAPRTRQSFNLGQYVNTYNVSTKVTSDQPVVSERAMYGNDRQWAHESVGATAPAPVWYLAEGCTKGGMETWVLVQNPNAAAVTVTLTLMTDIGPVEPPGLEDVTIPAGSRVSFPIGLYAVTYNVSTKVESFGGNVVCERAMYGGGRTWAHDSVGYSP